MAKLDEDDEIFMEKDEANRIKKYNYFKNQIEKIPYNLNKLKNSISESVEDYVETIDY